MISTQNVQEGKSMFPQRLEPGIHEVKITGVTSGNSAKAGTPFIELMFESAGGNHRETFYMKEGDSMKISLEKIKHLATKVVTEAELDAISAKTVPDYATKLEALLKGKAVRIKLVGKEQINTKTGKMFVERSFGYYPFAEAMDAKHSALRFNMANASDYKPLPKAGSAVDALDLDQGGSDDLPF